jgi:predicted DNA binding protein
MVVSTQVYAEHEDLALADTIRSLQDVDIGVVSDAGTDPDHEVYFFWFEAPDFGAVDSALEEDHTVAHFSTIFENEGRRVYRIEYTPEAKLISPPLTEIGGITLEAQNHLRGWLLELQFQDHAGIYELNEYVTDEEIRLDILELQQTEASHDRPDHGLTEPQREALIAAYVNGYYNEPRETSLETLAELLDISPTAVSGRLRRGSARLVEEVLVED